MVLVERSGARADWRNDVHRRDPGAFCLTALRRPPKGDRGGVSPPRRALLSAHQHTRTSPMARTLRSVVGGRSLVVRFGGAKRDTLFVEHHFAIPSMRQDGEDCGLARAASPGVKVAALPLWHHELSTHGRCHYGTNSGLPKMNLDIFVRCKLWYHS